MDDNENRFWSFLNSLGEKPSCSFRFFDRQDYYTVYNEDAELLATNYYKSMEVVKYFKRGSIPYININKGSSDSIFRFLLINNQYRVEIYSQSSKSEKDNNWTLEYTASPGNLEKFQDILFNNIEVTSSNTLLSLNIKKINEDYKVFLGFCDLDNGIFMLGSFEESFNGFDQLTNLTSALFQLNCRECLIPANDQRPEMIAVMNTAQRSGLLVTEVKKKQFFVDNVLENVTKLARKANFSGDNSILKMLEIEGKGSMDCLGAVISYLDLMTDEGFYNFFDIQSFKLDNFMRIGEQCSRALNFLPSPQDVTNNDSVYGILNCCRTSIGSRLLMQWLKQPLLDINLINNRLDIVESLVNDNTLRSSLYETNLRRIPDIQRITKRMQRKNANLNDLHKLYVALIQAKEIWTLLSNHEGPFKYSIESELCTDLEEICVSSEKFRELVESTIDLEAIQNHDFKVRADFDENLQECQINIDQLVNQINEEFSKVLDRLNPASVKQIKLEVVDNVGYYMRVSRKDESIIRGKSNVIIIDTIKDGVKFHSSKMRSMNENYLQYRLQYTECQKGIIEEIMNISRGYIPSLHKLGTIFAKLDVFCSLAIAAISAPGKYVRPKLLSDKTRKLYLKNCRHPIVELQSNVSYITNDVIFDDDNTFKIITGPNMGGKSTFLRSVGLNVVMAQIGSFVACDEAELTLSDRVMTRIGADDCQLKGISTFMAEMLDVSWILKTATTHSLIIIDELGRGTSTFDGFGLAWSISEYLVTELKAFTLFATHFHELTDLEKKYSNVCNLHVSAQTVDEMLVFLYKVKQGPSMKSYGLEVGKVAGLPDDVLEYAKLKLLEYEGAKQWGSDGVEEKKLNIVRESLRDFCKVDIRSEDVDKVLSDLRSVMDF